MDPPPKFHVPASFNILKEESLSRFKIEEQEPLLSSKDISFTRSCPDFMAIFLTARNGSFLSRKYPTTVLHLVSTLEHLLQELTNTCSIIPDLRRKILKTHEDFIPYDLTSYPSKQYDLYQYPSY